MPPFKLDSVYSPAADQPAAIASLAEGILAGERAVTLLGATGTGKTFVAMQIVWKLWNVAWRPGRNPRILYLADRNVLVTQARPPASIQVRLAAIESQGIPLRALGRGYERREQGDKALCMTMTIGCLVVQVFGVPDAGNHDFQHAGRTGSDFIGIYPPQMQTVAWPPHTVLDDASLLAFAHPLAAITDAPQPT